ncbi:MAG: Txe/YoeB family addiction module toxin [Nitrospinae bacterium]|nr:Txe/YoeB family addiction module toxin [Nitrospinota bacterium]
MNVSFTPTALEDFRRWIRHERKIADRILALLEEVKRTPFEGTGKPEPLKFNLAGCWSRRINLEHRLVYMVKAGEIVVIACRYHY